MLHLAFDCGQAIQNSAGDPLYGRVLFCERGTDTPVNIYTYAESVYTMAENPQYTDLNGFLPQSVFFEPSIITVRLYRYIGTMADPSADTDSDSWQFDRNFDVGFEVASAVNDTIVYTVAALRNSNTALSTVNVVGYFNNHDCGPRTYFWDANATDNEDGGYVIKSNSTATGRWILLWDDAVLPSEFYGVYPGSETNMSALLSYSQTVGTIAEHTAPVIHFVKGTYASAVSYITSRELMIEAGTQFTSASFTCPDVIMIGKNSAWIADFKFTKNAATAYSSWFRKLSKFYNCGAKKFVIDAVYGTSDTWSNSLTISGAEFVAAGASLPVIPNASDTVLILSGCIIGPAVFTSGEQYITFIGMEFTDKYFTGTWNTTYLNVTGAYLNCANFINPVYYFNAAVASGITAINMANSTAALGLSPASANVPEGAVISDLNITDAPNFRSAGALTLKNVNSTYTGQCAITAIGALTLNGCGFAGTVNAYGTTISADDCSFTNMDTSLASASSAALSDCVLSGNFNSYNASAASGSEAFISALNCKFEKNITTYDCILNNCTVAGVHTQYTKQAATASGYFYSTTFAGGQTFTGTSGQSGAIFTGGWSGCIYGDSFITAVNPESPAYTHLFNIDDSKHTYFFSGNKGSGVPLEFSDTDAFTFYEPISSESYSSPVYTFRPTSVKFFSIGAKTFAAGRLAAFIGLVEYGLAMNDSIRIFYTGAVMTNDTQIGTGAFTINGMCPTDSAYQYMMSAAITYSTVPGSTPTFSGEMCRTMGKPA